MAHRVIFKRIARRAAVLALLDILVLAPAQWLASIIRDLVGVAGSRVPVVVGSRSRALSAAFGSPLVRCSLGRVGLGSGQGVQPSMCGDDQLAPGPAAR